MLVSLYIPYKWLRSIKIFLKQIHFHTEEITKACSVICTVDLALNFTVMVWCKIKYFSFWGRSLPHHLLPSCGPPASDLVLTTAQVYPPPNFYTFVAPMSHKRENLVKPNNNHAGILLHFSTPYLMIPHFHDSQFHVPCFQRASHLRAKMSSPDLYFIDYRIRNWVTTTENSITPPMSRRPDKAVIRYSASTDCI